MGNLWVPQCAPPGEPSEPKQKGKKLKNNPQKCNVPTWNISIGIMHYQATCDTLSIELGEGVIFGASYKFGNDWGDDQLTLSLSSGVQTGLGNMKASADYGGYVTMQGSKMVDYGVNLEAKISTSLGPAKTSIGEEVRLSAQSGPDVSTSGFKMKMK